MLRSSILTIIFMALAVVLHAQDRNPELPFQVTKGAKGVVVKYTDYEKNLPFGFKQPKPGDTDMVYYFNKDGYAILSYSLPHVSYKHVIKNEYRYGKGKLIGYTEYTDTSIKHGIDKTELEQLKEGSNKIYKYDNSGHVIYGKWRSDPEGKFTMEDHYSYDNLGRLIKRVSNAFPTPPYRDSFIYVNKHDTSFSSSWKDGTKFESDYFSIQRFDKGGRLTENSTHKIGDTAYNGYFHTYNNNGQITEYREKSIDRVVSNGMVLRSDRVDYEYDSKGRLKKTTHYAEGEKVWEYLYEYF